ncbi:MAG: 3-deoxy-D-manno-octulosonic acid transferase [Hydrogenophaga sp.]|uniref:3-deoxy-D-manno-octulosonic acid transferase n=1 Tax=Hydrogenophaga sp. TaxID=1904254 RepID=UPI003D9B8450
MRRPLTLRAYGLLARALSPVWHFGLQRRLGRGKETPDSVQQKLGLAYEARPAGTLVWGHAVGVGESLALAGLFTRLGERRPDLHFLISTTARTSGDALKGRHGQSILPPRCQHQFAPVDTPDAVARFLDHWRPALAVWCEMDLWPALMDATDQRGIPRVLVNARLSVASLAKRRWGRWIYAALLPGFRALFAQNAESVDALVALGAPRERCRVTGTIKTLSPPLPCDADALLRWQTALAGRPVWLAASTHPGEEALALQAHEALRAQHQDALLLIAPRVPTRGAEVLALCPESTLQRSTDPSTLPGADSCVYLADTIGELGLWYRLAPVALVGGSMAEVGGHNPHEPLALGCTVLHGPNVRNFSESYAELSAQGLSRTVTSADELAAAVQAIWQKAQPRTPHRPRDPKIEAMVEQLDALLTP